VTKGFRRQRLEHWDVREAWLLKVIAELWKHRGLYPGLLRCLEVAGAAPLIDGVKEICIQEGHAKAHSAVFEVLDGGHDNILTKALDPSERKNIARNWKLLDDGARLLLREVLPRLDLSADIMEEVASENRAASSVSASALEIAANPYLIAEQFCGVDTTDASRGVQWTAACCRPPELGGKPLAGVNFNDERRFRALCVEHLRREPKHTFRFARDLVIEITERMNRLPAWKQAEFTERYFTVDADFLSGALSLRPVGDRTRCAKCFKGYCIPGVARPFCRAVKGLAAAAPALLSIATVSQHQARRRRANILEKYTPASWCAHSSR